jgi:hypothetical protein
MQVTIASTHFLPSSSFTTLFLDAYNLSSWKSVLERTQKPNDTQAQYNCLLSVKGFTFLLNNI